MVIRSIKFWSAIIHQELKRIELLLRLQVGFSPSPQYISRAGSRTQEICTIPCPIVSRRLEQKAIFPSLDDVSGTITFAPSGIETRMPTPRRISQLTLLFNPHSRLSEARVETLSLLSRRLVGLLNGTCQSNVHWRRERT